MRSAERRKNDLINGLIFDVYEFIRLNDIPIDETLFRLQDYLHNNFVGFVTENGTTAIFRNIDHTHSMKHYKMKIQYSSFIDYYKLRGGNPRAKKVVLAEGIFDIYSEHIFDHLNIKKDVKLYASVLSSKYSALLKSIIFYEQIFKPDVVILSDRGIPVWQYKYLKKLLKMKILKGQGKSTSMHSKTILMQNNYLKQQNLLLKQT